jgi:hypothetical protein
MVRSRSVPSPSSRITRTHKTPGEGAGGSFPLEVSIDPKTQNRKPPPSGPKRRIGERLRDLILVALLWTLAGVTIASCYWIVSDLVTSPPPWGEGSNPPSTP